MLKIFRAATSNILVWVLLVMLIVGLAGFGIGFGGGLAGNDVAQVGEKAISAQKFSRSVDQEIRSFSSQIGRPLSIDEARQFGIDRIALSRLVGQAAIDDAADELGLSSGDGTVREQLTSIANFQSAGGFDKEAYSFTLERMGMTAADFENDLRDEATRALISTAVTSAIVMPDTAALTVLKHVGEKRTANWIRLNEGQLTEPVPAPTPAELEAFHAEHEDIYTRPETKQISYAMATPESVAPTIEIPEADLRAAYDAAPDSFGTPERRLVDRIGFGTEQEAADAKASIDAGDTDFDSVAIERGLSADDADLGMVTASDLDAEASAAVFGAATPGVIGPVKTPLGPSLFRLNAILDGQVVSFEDARDELAIEQSTKRARTVILEDIRGIEDLIAGGSTLEEVADETVMSLGSLEFNSETTGDLATDPAFIALVSNAREGEETDLAELQDGGFVTVRLESVSPPAVIPLNDIRQKVIGDWSAAEVAKRLEVLANDYAEELRGGRDLSDLAEAVSVEVNTTEPLTRGGVVPGAPPRLLADMFALEKPGPFVVADESSVILADLQEIIPYDLEDENISGLLADLNRQLSSQVAADVLAGFTAALQNAAGVTVNQTLIETTLDQFQ